ncbi:C-type lectin-like, partial [Etheostoma cragini]|uniref:C-type lectin-like n=1 Tax=Etheostoma cragini TaxID=417921 RepID=UPI00155EDF14
VSNRHILVKEKMSWSDAQTYCRSKYTDLSTIGGSEDNLETADLLESLINDTDPVPVVWIGLHRNFWMWSDASKATFRSWGDNQPDMKDHCVKMQAKEKPVNWRTEKCDNTKFFVCYS